MPYNRPSRALGLYGDVYESPDAMALSRDVCLVHCTTESWPGPEMGEDIEDLAARGDTDLPVETNAKKRSDGRVAIHRVAVLGTAGPVAALC